MSDAIDKAVADMPNATRGGCVCPMCGHNYPHTHTPEEITIFRNGAKFERKSAGASPAPEQTAEEPALGGAGQSPTVPTAGARQFDESVKAIQGMNEQEQAAAEQIAATARLAWLHGPGSNNVDGYEWGIYRVKWVNGKAAEVWQTCSDFSDLDAALRSTLPQTTGGKGS